MSDGVIGIDPAYAKPIALAYRVGRKWHVGEMEPDDVAKHLPTHLCLAMARGVTECVIEDGFVGANAKVSLKLAQMRGRIESVAMAAGLKIRMVAPATWQAATLCQGNWRPTRHDEIVHQAILRARGVTGMDLPEDQAVAVCIAEWGDGWKHE